METVSPAISGAEQLADRLELDIQNRGLGVGDRYFTTAEAAEMLGVSVSSAHRAMKLLADRNLITRRHKAGTFVGPKGGGAENKTQAPKIRTVHLLVPWMKKESFYGYLEPISRGLHNSLPQASVQFSIIPDERRLAWVRKLISDVRLSGGTAGIIAASCPLDVYELLAESELPTVVLGSLSEFGPKLPCIDLDNREGGRLLAEHLIQRGHRRIELITLTMDRHGDKLFFDGINEALTAASLPPNTLSFHVMPEEIGPLQKSMRRLLEQPDCPTGIIARIKRMADVTAACIAELKQQLPEDIEVVFIDHTTDQVESSSLTHVRTKVSRQENAALVGQMLATMSEGKPLKDGRITVPVRLCR